MSPIRCEIFLNSGEDQINYYPGDVIEGKFIVYSTSDFHCKGFALGLECNASLSFGSKCNCKETSILKGFLPIFGNFTFNQCDEPQFKAVTPDIKVNKGVYKSPFIFQCPTENIPCSFACPLGTIRYKIVVYLMKGERSIKLQEKSINLTIPANYLILNKEISRPKTILRGGLAEGDFKIEFKLNKGFLLPIENVPFVLRVFNCNSANTKVSLIQKMEFKGVEECRTIKRRLFLVQKDDIRNFWSDYIKMPQTITPTQFGNKIDLMEITYFLKVHVQCNNSKETIRLEIPIQVGSLPKKNPKTGQYIVYPPSKVKRIKNQLFIIDNQKLGSDGNQNNARNSIELNRSLPTYSELSINKIGEPPTYEEAIQQHMNKMRIK